MNNVNQARNDALNAKLKVKQLEQANKQPQANQAQKTGENEATLPLTRTNDAKALRELAVARREAAKADADLKDAVRDDTKAKAIKGKIASSSTSKKELAAAERELKALDIQQSDKTTIAKDLKAKLKDNDAAKPANVAAPIGKEQELKAENKKEDKAAAKTDEKPAKKPVFQRLKQSTRR